MDESIDQVPAARVHYDVVALEKLDPVFNRTWPLERLNDVEAQLGKMVDRLGPGTVGSDFVTQRASNAR